MSHVLYDKTIWFDMVVQYNLYNNHVLDIYACLVYLKLAFGIEQNISKSANIEKYFLNINLYMVMQRKYFMVYM